MRGDRFCSSSESHVVWFLLLWARFLQIKGTEGHALSGNTVLRSLQYYSSIFLFWQVKQQHLYKWKQLENSINPNNTFMCILSFINEIEWSGETGHKNVFSLIFSLGHRIARGCCKYILKTVASQKYLCANLQLWHAQKSASKTAVGTDQVGSLNVSEC